MPKIQWSNLAPELRDHLFERARERKISIEDLFKLKLWRETEPDAPDGPWYKDFAHSKFAAKVNSQKPSSSAASPQKERRLNRTTDQSSIFCPSSACA
jgi:hypothetical protein